MSKKVQGKKLSSFKVEIKKDNCKGCGLCIAYCPVDYLSFSSKLNRKGVMYAMELCQKKCIGCGNCFLICPDNCIEIYRKQKKGNSNTGTR